MMRYSKDDSDVEGQSPVVEVNGAHLDLAGRANEVRSKVDHARALIHLQCGG